MHWRASLSVRAMPILNNRFLHHLWLGHSLNNLFSKRLDARKARLNDCHEHAPLRGQLLLLYLFQDFALNINIDPRIFEYIIRTQHDDLHTLNACIVSQAGKVVEFIV